MRGRLVADAAAQFAGDRDGRGDALHPREIPLLAAEGRVEIDDVQVIAAFLRPAFGEGHGVVGIDGLLGGLSLAQAHHLAGHEIDGGKNQHEQWLSALRRGHAFHEIPQHGQPRLLAFFRVKLHARDVPERGPGGESFAVGRLRRNHIRALGRGKIGVHEKKVGLGRERAPERVRRLGELQRIPADLRHLQPRRGEALHLAREKTEALFAGRFLARLEQTVDTPRRCPGTAFRSASMP